jgi:hypothetical protein
MKTNPRTNSLIKTALIFFLGLFTSTVSAQFEIESLYPDQVEMCVGQTLTITPTANPLNPASILAELTGLGYNSAILDGIPGFSFDPSNGVIVLNSPPTSGQFDIVIESEYAVRYEAPTYVTESVFATITVVVNSPVLGEYPNITMSENGNIQIVPDSVPECVQSVTAQSPDFPGDLVVNPNTGIVTVTNAKTPGIYSVTVSRFSDLGTGSVNRSFQLTVTASNACSTSFNELTANGDEVNNGNAVIGDFNNDGIQDIANVVQTDNYFFNVNTQILLGDGNGGFLSSATQSSYLNLNPERHQITAGDFNGDGNLDVAGITWERAFIQYGNGAGGLTATQDIDFPSIPGDDFSYLNALTIGHFNDDTRLDLAIAYTERSFDNAQIRILYGANGSGFSRGPSYDIGVDDKDPVKLTRGNFNADGLDELLVVYKKRFDYDDVQENNEICEGVQINTAGELVPFITLNAFGVQAVAAGDLDGQGTFDIAALTRNGIEIFLNGNVNNQNPNQFIALDGAYNDIKTINKNGDGFLDLIISSTAEDKITVLLGDGSGGFTEDISVDVLDPMGLTIGDFNGDFIPDCLVNNSGNSVLMGANNTLSLISLENNTETELGSNRLKYIQISNTGTGDLVIDRSAISLSGSDPDLFTIIGQSTQSNNTDQANFSADFPIHIDGLSTKYIVLLFQPEEVGIFSADLTIQKGSCTNPVRSTELIETCISSFTGALGQYPTLEIYSGENKTIDAMGGSYQFDRLIATTHTNFDGIISIESDGRLSVTNAIKAGTYTVTVKGFVESIDGITFDPGVGFGTITKLNSYASTTFQLEVLDPICSPGGFDLAMSIDETADEISNLTAIAIGDFDNDGNQDLITSYSNTSAPNVLDFGNIDFTEDTFFSSFMKKGNGFGEFEDFGPGFKKFIAGFDPRSIHVDDYNGDGIHDFVAANSDFLGNTFTRVGKIGFLIFELPAKAPPVDTSAIDSGNIITPVGAFYSKDVAFGDFNGDGIKDMAIVSEGVVAPVIGAVEIPGVGTLGIPATVSIQLGDGRGGISSELENNFKQSKLVFVGDQAVAIVVGDFNADGIDDFATASESENKISVRLGTRVTVVDALNLELQGFEFETKPDVPVGDGPSSMVMGDFNGDGIQDLAVACRGVQLPGDIAVASGFVSVRLGNGSGGFTACSTCEIEVGLGPSSIKIGDFNGDSIQDFVVTNTTGDDISIRFGNGDGSFYGDTEIPVGEEPLKLVIGDFNEDHVQDIAVANRDDISILLGTASGIQSFVLKGNGFTIPMNSTSPIPGNHTDFGYAGFEGSPITREFTIENTGETALKLTEDAISISGTDSDLFSLDSIAYPIFIAAGASYSFNVDFEPTFQGEKTATITVVNTSCVTSITNSFAVKATVIPPPVLGVYPDTVLTLGANATIMADGDAAPINTLRAVAYTDGGFTGELLVNPSTGALSVINAGQSGIFQVSIQAFTIDDISTISTFLLTVTNPETCVSEFTNTANTDFNQTGTDPSDVTLGDFNQDGNQDVLITNKESLFMSLKFGNGVDGFASETTLPVALNTTSADVADFNGDGYLDIAALNEGNQGVYIFLGNGDGSFQTPSQGSLGSSPTTLAIGDFNNDGNPDIAFARTSDNSYFIYLGNGTGRFIQTAAVPVGNAPQHLVIANFNRDDFLDIAVANFDDNTVSIRLGNGDGSFSGTTDIPVGQGPNHISIGDFNNDTNQDLVIANSNGTTMSIVLGDGLGTALSVTEVTTTDVPAIVKVGEFNGDGIQDVVSISALNTGNLLKIYSGNGTGGFTEFSSIDICCQLSALAIGNINNDALSDIVLATQLNSNLQLLLGTSPIISVTGNDTAITDGATTPTEVNNTDFGLVQQGTTSVKTFEIENSGNKPLNIFDITFIGDINGLFSVDNITLPATILAGETQTFQIEFDASTIGEKEAVVHIQTDACNFEDYDFAITGTGVDTPVIEIYAYDTNSNLTYIIDGETTPTITNGTDFGETCINTELLRSFSIKNITTIPVTLEEGSITIDNSLFTLEELNLPITLQPEQSLEIGVTFLSDSEGLEQGELNVVNIGGDFNYNFVISGTSSNEILSASSYVNSSVDAGANVSISPSSAPENARRISAHANENFSGILTVNPLTGMLSVTNAGQPGIYTIDVTTFGLCSEDTTTFTLTVTDPDCSDGELSKINEMNFSMYLPRNYAIADFNNDGIQDFAVVFSYTQILVKIGNGDGTFSQQYLIGSSSTNFKELLLNVGDFNGDGNQDIAVVGIDAIKMYLGDGTGNLVYASIYSTAPLGLYFKTTTADFNNDGNLDILIAKDNSLVTIHFGNGNGEFFDEVENTIIEDLYQVSLGIGDFDEDGNMDIALTDYDSDVLIYFGDGIGGFNSNTSIPDIGSEILTGDINNDGFEDLITFYDISDSSYRGVRTYLGGGDGTFENATFTEFSEDLNSPIGGMVLSDFNGDGNSDLAISFGRNQRILKLMSDGSGGFYTQNEIIQIASVNTTTPLNLLSGDLNGDGKQDLLALNVLSGSLSKIEIFAGQPGYNAEIELKGNDIIIENDDITPNSNDGTDFGDVCVNGTVTKTYTIKNTGVSFVILPQITIVGSDTDDFTITAPLVPILFSNQSTTFTVTFAPMSQGVKTAEVIYFLPSSCDFLYRFTIQGSTEELEPPIIECPLLEPVYYANANSCYTNIPLVVTATDNCTLNPVITSNAPLNNQFPVGDTTVVYTATDANGNTATCEIVVTVVDNIAPTLLCAAPITVAYGDSLDPAVIGGPEATDNCTIESLVFTESSTQGTEGCSVSNYTINRFWIATDGVGNSQTCVQVINVVDETGPTVIIQDITVTLNSEGTASITTEAIDNGSSDTCGIDSLVLDTTSFDCSNIGDNTVTLSVTDANGNVSIATAIVTVVDDSLPEAIAQDITVALEASGTVSITADQIDNGSNDNCGIASIAVDNTSFDCSTIGANSVLLTVTDNNGNVATATATVTVESTTVTEAIAKDITVILNASGTASIIAGNIDDGSNAACGNITITVDTTSFGCDNVGENTVLLTVTDEGNNTSTATAIVTVVDATLPEAIAQDITVTLDANGTATITPEAIDNGSNDACGVVSLELDITTFNTDDIGENTVQLTVTDTNGNVSVVSAIVTVVDDSLGIDDIALDLGLSVYPNPTQGSLNLKMASFNKANLSYQLFSLQGQLLLRKAINNDITNIPMHRLSEGMYLLKVNLNNKEIKSFKIIKKEQ